MTVFIQLNTWLGTYLPSPFWDFLEAFLGLSIAIATLAQRTLTPRFKSHGIRCSFDWITTRAGQVGLAIIGTMAFMVFIDAISVRDQQPRAFAVLSLFGYFLVQLRVIYLSFLGLWPLHGTQLAHKMDVPRDNGR